jgi:peptidyl-prolyl cis-trans isomerase D
MEVFQTEGVFDPVKYNQFLSDPTTYSDPNNKFFVMQVEEIVRQQWLNYRLQSILKETVQVSPAELRGHFEDRNELVEVEYLFVPSSSISDGEVALSAEDLEAYFQENAEDYRHPEQIRMEFVAFPKTASAEDSALVAKEIRTLRKEVLAGADFEALARSVSEDEGSAVNGGDLGVFGRGRMVQAFEQVAFELEPGQVSEPVMTPFGWHLIKAEERLQEDGQEQIRARHILLKFNPSRRTQESLSKKAEEFREVAENLSFPDAVGVTGMQSRDSGYLQKGQAVPSLGPDTAWLVNQFFDSEVGAVSQVLQNDRFFWVAQLSERREEGVAALEEVRQQVERMARLERKAEACSRRLEGVRQQVLGGRSLDQAAAEENLEVRRPEPFSRSESVPDIGRRNAFVGAAFRLEPGELSEVVTLPRGAYLIRAVDKVAADEDQFQAEREQLAQQLLIERQNEVLQTWFTQIFQSADIQDNRHRFFTF